MNDTLERRAVEAPASSVGIAQAALGADRAAPERSPSFRRRLLVCMLAPCTAVSAVVVAAVREDLIGTVQDMTRSALGARRPRSLECPRAHAHRGSADR